METLQESISKLQSTHCYPERIQKILQLVIENKMRISDLESVLSDIKVKRINDLKESLTEVLVDYANLCLEDSILTQAEMQNFRTLKRFFKIQEGDFYKCHKERDVKEILTLQLEKIQSDKVVDISEALMKTDLQEMFGLSYDQFLEIENKVAKKSLKNGANIIDLDTFIKK